ncbi:hypothetical protein A2U01_0065144, partial [Trifolium medium]|nr:hypothetical protein [Trifolium medium]
MIRDCLLVRLLKVSKRLKLCPNPMQQMHLLLLLLRKQVFLELCLRIS